MFRSHALPRRHRQSWRCFSLSMRAWAMLADVHYIVIGAYEGPGNTSAGYKYATGNYPQTAISEAQRAWLQRDLAVVNRSITPWVVVNMHPPCECCLIPDRSRGRQHGTLHAVFCTRAAQLAGAQTACGSRSKHGSTLHPRECTKLLCLAASDASLLPFPSCADTLVLRGPAAPRRPFPGVLTPLP